MSATAGGEDRSMSGPEAAALYGQLSRRRAALERQQAGLLDQAGGPRDPRLGCSTIAHDRLGYCGDCPQVGHRLEAAGWQLLALAQDEAGA